METASESTHCHLSTLLCQGIIRCLSTTHLRMKIYQKHFLTLSGMVSVNEEIMKWLISQFLLSDGDCSQQLQMEFPLHGRLR